MTIYLIGWSLTALSAQKGYNMPCRKFVKIFCSFKKLKINCLTCQNATRTVFIRFSWNLAQMIYVLSRKKTVEQFLNFNFLANSWNFTFSLSLWSSSSSGAI